MRIHTERLTLRPFRSSDRDRLRSLLDGIDLQDLFDSGGRPLTATRLANTLIRDGIVSPRGTAPVRLSLAIVPRGCRIAVGGALLACDAEGGADIGLWLVPEFRGRGLGREALTALLRFGFDFLGRMRITGLCKPTNRESIRLMETCGMRYQHRLTAEDRRGAVVERVVYAVTRP